MLKFLFLVPLLPLLGAAINGLLGRRLRFGETTVGSSPAGRRGSRASSRSARSGITPRTIPPARTWTRGSPTRGSAVAESTAVRWAYQMDPLAAVMTFVVTFVGFLIHVFATGYMQGEAGFYRFFAYLNLFMFMMLVLVLGSNFPMMFVGWEGVGLCSYLLIGFYFERDEAGGRVEEGVHHQPRRRHGLHARHVRRLRALRHARLRAARRSLRAAAGRPPTSRRSGTGASSSWIAFGLFVGAIGKSAQIPLYVWLPDAMAGPTPVSALIHAATMVTAGVYMVDAAQLHLPGRADGHDRRRGGRGGDGDLRGDDRPSRRTTSRRCSPTRPSRSSASCSWPAASGRSPPAIFHVLTHAFFKALLFLGSGSVIHGMHHEQDMRQMGG